MSCINLMPPWFITATLAWLVAALPIPPDGPGWVEIRAGGRCPLLEVVLSFRWWQPQPLLCTMYPQTFLFIPLPFKPQLAQVTLFLPAPMGLPGHCTCVRAGSTAKMQPLLVVWFWWWQMPGHVMEVWAARVHAAPLVVLCFWKPSCNWDRKR